jgi:CRP-like cAMP-binding protein
MTHCELLFLERKIFNSMMARHPELKNELTRLTSDRIQKTKEALNPESDEFILIEEDDVIML